MTYAVLILPRTQAGRELLLDVLPFAGLGGRSNGVLPDGSSIYGVNFDVLAREIAGDFDAFKAWQDCKP